MLTATVSGSFHRHLTAIYTAVGELREAGVDVLSPADPRVVDHIGEFLFVASDRLRSIHLVQDRHLECIANSSFLWLVAPDGYVGPRLRGSRQNSNLFRFESQRLHIKRIRACGAKRQRDCKSDSGAPASREDRSPADRSVSFDTRVYASARPAQFLLCKSAPSGY